MSDLPGEISHLLFRLKGGDRSAEDQLVPLVYKELRRLAAVYMRNERYADTLQPTALVHEAYLRLTRLQKIDWQSRSHFFAVSATVMRRILVEHARAQAAEKRGDRAHHIDIHDLDLAAPFRSPQLLALDEALYRLASMDLRQSKIVELRFFGGLSEEETGLVLGLSARTVKRDWRIAKAWLYSQLAS
jgi:RNA polymerase sigma-70 factor (ECF subfamily)